MSPTSGILLSDKFDNFLQIGGEQAWFLEPENAGSTGYTWKFVPDDSGVYEEVEEISLHSATRVVGPPGERIWKFQAVRPGRGSMKFLLLPPGEAEPSEVHYVNVNVS